MLSWQPKNCFSTPRRRRQWYGLVGIDLEVKPGRYSLKGTVSFTDGQNVELEQVFQVLPKTFPVQRIQVEEKYVTLDPKAEKRCGRGIKEIESHLGNVHASETLARPLSRAGGEPTDEWFRKKAYR